MGTISEGAIETAAVDLGFCRLGAEAWAKADNISRDYAVMEKAANLSVVPFDGCWSDLGGWDAVLRESPKNEVGVLPSGEATAIDCEDTSSVPTANASKL